MAERIDGEFYAIRRSDDGKTWAIYFKDSGAYCDERDADEFTSADDLLEALDEQARRFIQKGREQLTTEIEKSIHIGEMVSVENYEHPHYADTHRWPVVITFEGDEGYWHQRGDTFVEALLLDPLEITKRNIAHDVKNGNEPYIPCPVCLERTEKIDSGVDTRWECVSGHCDGVWAGEPSAWQPKSEPTPEELSPEGVDRG